MVIILICRFVKPDKEEEFLRKYNEDQVKNAGIEDFICETLTKVDNTSDLPKFLRNLPLTRKDCLNYLNVAYWKSAKSFAQRFTPKAPFDHETEVAERLRAVLNIQQTTCQIFGGPPRKD